MTARNPNSEVTGDGYGASHNWKKAPTVNRATLYKCADCEDFFLHHYAIVPDIHEAMKVAGMPDACPGREE